MPVAAAEFKPCPVEDHHAFYTTALALGGTDEGAPGERAQKLYRSYFRDLDANTLCAYSTT